MPDGVRIRYQTYEFGDTDIHVRSLRDTLQFGDAYGEAAALGIFSSNWAYFGVVWQAGETLAHLMSDEAVKGKRILEVGCGIGLASLLLNHRDADITATDYHPAVEEFLQTNASLNGDKEIPFVRTSWSEKDRELGRFDLIIGSDVLYERGQSDDLVGFIEDHARKCCEVIIVDAGRGYAGHFGRKMKDLGYSQTKSKALQQQAAKALKGHVHRFSR